MVHWAVTQGCSQEPVQFVSDGAAIRGFLTKPTHVPVGAPAVLLLHEWWGLNDTIRERARRLATEGYVTLAVDLYSRQGSKVTAVPQEAAALMNAVSSQHVLRDLNAATRWLKALPAVDPLRIGIVGFSMGGTLALTQAGHNSDLKACVVFYGKVPPIESFRYFLCPIQYHYGAKEQWVTRKEVDLLRDGLQQQGKPFEIHIYPDADHGFINEGQRDVYRSDDARLAWTRTLAFLQTHLR